MRVLDYFRTAALMEIDHWCCWSVYMTLGVTFTKRIVSQKEMCVCVCEAIFLLERIMPTLLRAWAQKWQKWLMNVPRQCFVSAPFHKAFYSQKHILQYSGAPQKYNKSQSEWEPDVSRRSQFISLFHILWSFTAGSQDFLQETQNSTKIKKTRKVIRFQITQNVLVLYLSRCRLYP